MARTISEIKNAITARFIVEPSIVTIYNLDTAKTFEQQFSVVSIESLLFYTIAVAMFTLETIFDVFKYDVDVALLNLKPHTAKWYAVKALAYLHGVPLLPDSDQFNKAAYTPAQLVAANVVKHAAVVEQVNSYGRISLRIKLAREVGTALEALTGPQLTGAVAYFARIKDAGVKLQIDSLPADALKLVLDIYYDPLTISATGARLDGTDAEPVQKAVRNYLKNLPFNGTFVLAFLVDAIQKVPGVVIPEIKAASARYGLFPFTAINTEYNPDAGYLKLYTETTDLLLNFIPHNSF